MMNKFHLKVVITLAMVVSFCHLTSAQVFPITFTSDSLAVAKDQVSDWQGKIVTTQCKIAQLEEGYEGKPYYKCSYQNNTSIWIASLMSDKDSLNLDDTVLVIGYFTQPDPKDLLPSAFHADPFHLMVFGVINLTQKNMYLLPGAETQFREWQNGMIRQPEK